MHRRRFLHGLCGLPALLPLLGKAAEEPSYYYDWQASSTNDPRFSDSNLPYGGPDVHRVLINGKDSDDFGPVVRMQTGPNGWIEYRAQDRQGNWIIDPRTDKPVRVRYRGNVRYEVYRA